MESNHFTLVSIDFSSKLFSIKAIQRAAYDLSAHVKFEFEHKPDEIIGATLFFDAENGPKPDEMKDRFKQSVFDHQVRLDVDKETQFIRKLIITQAFFSCENLQEIIDTIHDEEAI